MIETMDLGFDENPSQSPSTDTGAVKSPENECPPWEGTPSGELDMSEADSGNIYADVVAADDEELEIGRAHV